MPINPAYIRDECLLSANGSEVVVHRNASMGLPDKTLCLKLLFADHSSRAFDISNPALQGDIALALAGGLEYCTDRQPVLDGGSGGGTYLQPPLFSGECFGRRVTAVRPTFYRNALVLDISMGSTAERWTVTSQGISFLRDYLGAFFQQLRVTLTPEEDQKQV